MATDNDSRKIFTLEAANSMIPRLNVVVGEQMQRRSAIEGAIKKLRGLVGEGAPQTLAPDPSDASDVRSLKREVATRIEEYEGGWKALEDMGAVLKDARTGLVDFYGHVEGKLVWLCWKYGESEIAHYHALDEGFSARRELRASIKMRHLN